MNRDSVEAIVDLKLRYWWRSLTVELFQRLLLFRLTLIDRLLHNGLDVLGNFSSEIIRIDLQLTLAVQGTGHNKQLAIGGQCNVKNTSRHCWKLADQIGIVTDLSLGLSEDSVDLGSTISTTDQHLVFRRVHGQCVDATFERSRRDRRHVVDEAFRRHFGQLNRHVATARDYVRT